jgi:hypothetical protein
VKWIPGRNEKSALDHNDDERDHSEGDHQELLALHGVAREVDERKGFHSKLKDLCEVGYGQETALYHDVGEDICILEVVLVSILWLGDQSDKLVHLQIVLIICM